jgi:hypothetical protein
LIFLPHDVIAITLLFPFFPAFYDQAVELEELADDGLSLRDWKCVVSDCPGAPATHSFA